MRFSFRNLKRGEIYLLTRELILWESSAEAYRKIPAGAHFLVVDDDGIRIPVGKAYRVLVDGTVGTLLVREGDVLPVEEA